MRPGRGLRGALLLIVLAGAMATPAHAFFHPTGFRPVAGNPAERLAGTPAEALSTYSAQKGKRCSRASKPGTKRFVSFLKHYFKRGRLGGIYRCENLGNGNGYSLHSENRAVDWTVSVHSSADRKAVERMVRLLLAPDSTGLDAALARRMGLFEIIWDCGYWSHDQQRDGRGFIPYFLCPDPFEGGTPDPTIGHRNHIHFGLTRAGAAAKTSFWRR